MDFYVGSAVLLVDGESCDVTAFVDSARGRGIQDWGGFLLTGDFSEVTNLRALGSYNVQVQIPGCPSRDIGVLEAHHDGIVFRGIGRTPLPLPGDRNLKRPPVY